MNKLRDQFFKECTIEINGIKVHNLTPHNTFEWFTKQMLNVIPKFAEYLNDNWEYKDNTDMGNIYYLKERRNIIHSVSYIFDMWISNNEIK